MLTIQLHSPFWMAWKSSLSLLCICPLFMAILSIQTYEHMNKLYRHQATKPNNQQPFNGMQKNMRKIDSYGYVNAANALFFNYQRHYYCFSAFDSITCSKEYCFVSHATWTLSLIWVQKRKKLNKISFHPKQRRKKNEKKSNSNNGVNEKNGKTVERIHIICELWKKLLVYNQTLFECLVHKFSISLYILHPLSTKIFACIR